MPLTLITGPADEPVSATDFKDYVAIDTNDNDQMIAEMLKEARGVCEAIIKRALITQTWEYTLDCFPDEVLIPLPPLVSVTSVKYIDTNGILQIMDSLLYEVDTYGIPARLRPAYGKCWPGTRDVYNAVTIQYVAGYGSEAIDVPDPIRSWIKQRAATQYANREGVVVGQTVTPIPRDYVNGLLDEYRVILFR